MRCGLRFGVSLMVVVWGGSSALLGQTGTAPSLPQNAAAAASANGELPPPKLPKRQEFSKAEIQAECRKYEGKTIAFYDQIFLVKNCKRHELITDDDNRNGITKSQKIQSVEGTTIAKIPAGDAIGQSKEDLHPSCAKLEGHYVMTRADEVYYIEGCKKQLIPDWDTYAEHAAKKGKKGTAILEMSEAEISRLKSLPDMKSVLDAEYKKLLDAEKPIDLLPLEEACKGLNGKFVSYYSKIYRIEKCKKRPVDAERFGVKNPRLKVEEISAEQWISLPTGQEFKL